VKLVGPDNYDPKRGTGRTTRMLMEAIALAKEGRRVTVVVTGAQRNSARMMIEEAGVEALVKVEHSTFLARTDFVVSSLRVRGEEPSHVLLIDHYVLEERYRAVFEMATRYDSPTHGQLAIQHAELKKAADAVCTDIEETWIAHGDWFENLKQVDDCGAVSDKNPPPSTSTELHAKLRALLG
jgi:hypothetical protein